jgi:hypothetical protein
MIPPCVRRNYADDFHSGNIPSTGSAIPRRVGRKSAAYSALFDFQPLPLRGRTKYLSMREQISGKSGVGCTALAEDGAPAEGGVMATRKTRLFC